MESAGGFGSGTYQFPIKFRIPTGLPGTFVHSFMNRNATLNYNMYIEVFEISSK